MNMRNEPIGSDPGTGRQISPKLIGFGVLVAVVLVFIAQNTDKVQYNFFFWDVNAPQWLWLLALLVAGVVIGSIFPWLRPRKRRRDD